MINCVFSSRSRIALAFPGDSESALLLELDDELTSTEISIRDANQTRLAHAQDIQSATCESIEDAATKFQEAVRCSQALDLVLFLFDETFSSATHRLAATELESHLSSVEVLRYLQHIFYSKPLGKVLPANANDLVRERPTVHRFVERLSNLQESISVVRTAWDDLDLEAIVPELAKGSLSRSDIEGICIRNGVFCELVETMAQSANFGEAMLRLSKSGSLATELPSINRVIAAWTGPLSKKRLSRTLELQEHILGHNEHVFDDDIDEDDLLSVTGKPSRARTSLSAVARQVAHKNALDKVSQIVALVSSGESERARALIDHLVAFQTETSGIDHVLKSLCNVATQCRRLLRDDIAIECLIKALALSSKDAVTFSQLGTQLRDCDLFEEARQAYDKSLSLLDRDDLFHKQITLSARAHVLTEQGKYEDALTEYRSIPFGDDSFSVRTAIADVYRRQGYLATAMSEYVKLLRDDRKWDRAWAGKAEIAKRRGDPHRAIRIYNSLLDPAKFQIDEVSRSVYELASCQLYKRVGQYDKALSLANSILEREPHLFGAKLQLSSLLTLKGNAADGLRQILRPAGSTQSTNWRVELLEGLTLYRLRRAAEARKHLLERIDLSSVLSEDQPMIRCSMAYAHLSAQDSESALTVLRATHPVDRGLRNLKTILEAHANILLDDTRTGTGISLSRMPRSHRYLRSAVDSVRAGNLADAALAELSYLIIAV